MDENQAYTYNPPQPQSVLTAYGIETMNVFIDRMDCVSCGACWNTCPEVFDQNHCDSFAEIIEEYRFNGNRAEAVIPDCLGCCAQEAADLCPLHIIQIS